MAAMANPYQYMPTEPGKSSDQVGFEQLCTRWNQEEAEADGEDANVQGMMWELCFSSLLVLVDKLDNLCN